MSEPVLLVLGLAVTIALAVVAKRFSLPYPIVFMLAGTALAFLPGLPVVHIAPDWIFLTILPPLLFSGGWQTDWAMFRFNLRPILQLAIGLVLVSALVVAVVTKAIIPEMSWPVAFVLGSIVSPPDAVAAMATFERFSVPRRIVTILEGEGLINDVTALVLYGYAVTAVLRGTFSFAPAAISFVFVAAGGIAVGWFTAWITERIERALTHYELNDSLIDSLSIIGAAYGAYLLGQALHVSGILATVVAGVLVSQRASVIYSPETRLISANVWSVWIYVLNAYVFLAIGLQLRGFLAAPERAVALLPAALAISAVLIVVRLIWIYPTAVIPRWIPAVRRYDPRPPWSWLTVLGWSGMRGIVSLAAALALPEFPGREDIIFITFVVIFVTLVGQGLSLIPLLKFLKLPIESDTERREIEVRVAALRAGLERIDEMRAKHKGPEEREVLDRLHDEYAHRIEHLSGHTTRAVPETAESRFDHEAQTAAIHAERREIRRLRDRGEIPDEIFRRVQYDMDLAESRLF